MSEFTDDDRKALIETRMLVREMKAQYAQRLDDHEQRLRKNEAALKYMIGFAAAIGAGIAQAAEIVKLKFGG